MRIKELDKSHIGTQIGNAAFLRLKNVLHIKRSSVACL